MGNYVKFFPCAVYLLVKKKNFHVWSLVEKKCTLERKAKPTVWRYNRDDVLASSNHNFYLLKSESCASMLNGFEVFKSLGLFERSNALGYWIHRREKIIQFCCTKLYTIWKLNTIFWWQSIFNFPAKDNQKLSACLTGQNIPECSLLQPRSLCWFVAINCIFT